MLTRVHDNSNIILQRVNNISRFKYCKQIYTSDLHLNQLVAGSRLTFHIKITLKISFT